MKQNLFAAFALSILCTLMWSHAAQAEPLPEYRSVLVNDFADMLSDETEATLEEMLLSAREARDHEMTLVTITRLADYDGYSRIEPFAKDLFNKWGVGNAERNDGLMLVVSLDDRRIRLALGSGYPARFDGVATRIIERDMVPKFRAGDPEAGIIDGTRAALSDLRLDEQTTQSSPFERDEFETRSTGLIDRIKNRIDTSPLGRGISMVLMALALPASALLAVFGIRVGRKHLPRSCPECGRRMHKLGSVQEDQFLEPGQIIEERMNSRDYGVWVCPHDEHVTIKSFPRLFSKVKACKSCGYHTAEVTRTVMTPATTTSTGMARHDHRCGHCGHHHSEDVVIAKKPRNSNSSSFGGSGGGGGFGGGRSSGGGGSGSW